MKKIIGVIGGSFAEQKYLDYAFEVGRLLAKREVKVICGGLGGVMESVCRGVAQEGGLSLGILPADITMANEFVTIPIATGMGSARNKIIIETGRAFIAIAGAYGTLGEIAMALDSHKKVIGLGTWEIPGVIMANSPQEAVELAVEGL